MVWEVSISCHGTPCVNWKEQTASCLLSVSSMETLPCSCGKTVTARGQTAFVQNLCVGVLAMYGHFFIFEDRKRNSGHLI